MRNECWWGWGYYWSGTRPQRQRLSTFSALNLILTYSSLQSPQCRSSSNWNWLHAKNTCVCTVHWLESEAPVIGFNSVIHSPYKYADWNIQHCHPLQFHFITISVSNNPWLVVESCECQLRYFHHSQCFPTYSLCPSTANVHIAKKSKNPLNVFLPPAWHDSGLSRGEYTVILFRIFEMC